MKVGQNHTLRPPTPERERGGLVNAHGPLPVRARQQEQQITAINRMVRSPEDWGPKAE